jgi:hypothetical protein
LLQLFLLPGHLNLYPLRESAPTEEKKEESAPTETKTEGTVQTEEKKEEKKEEEEVDIDLDDPNTENAALKIQAGFRGYKTRKEINLHLLFFFIAGFNSNK